MSGAELETDAGGRRVPAERAGRGAGDGGVSAPCPPPSRAEPPRGDPSLPPPAPPPPPRAMLLPSDVARLVLGECGRAEGGGARPGPGASLGGSGGPGGSPSGWRGGGGSRCVPAEGGLGNQKGDEGGLFLPHTVLVAGEAALSPVGVYWSLTVRVPGHGWFLKDLMAWGVWVMGKWEQTGRNPKIRPLQYEVGKL